MATKAYTIGKDWVKVNNGGLVDGNSVIIKIKTNPMFIGTTTINTNPPEVKDCYYEKEGIVYTGIDDLWVRAANLKTSFIVDSI